MSGVLRPFFRYNVSKSTIYIILITHSRRWDVQTIFDQITLSNKRAGSRDIDVYRIWITHYLTTCNSIWAYTGNQSDNASKKKHNVCHLRCNKWIRNEQIYTTEPEPGSQISEAESAKLRFPSSQVQDTKDFFLDHIRYYKIITCLDIFKQIIEVI